MNEEMTQFVGLSAVLTGFDVRVLAPGIDPVDVKSDYLAHFKQAVASESGDAQLVGRILAHYAVLKAKGSSDEQIGTAMLNESNGAAFVLACRKLIFLWYAGAWPTLIPASGDQPASTVSQLLSDKSYTAGLVWRVMQSHPMGDSNFHYGYWGEPPQPLSDFTGHNHAGGEQ